jgi:hypothetical protein
MRKQAACLSALLLAACSAETPSSYVMMATQAPAAGPATSGEQAAEADFAADARSFFFLQADLYLAGASTADDGKLADVLRAMGRDDLVQPSVTPEPDWRCPRQWVDPVEMIARAAEGSRIVIIESERNISAQTAFAEAIVTRLAADGFTAYADDSLTLDPGGAAHPDVLLVSEGMVTRDPGHGRLMRIVKSSGLQIVDAGVWWRSLEELAALSPSEFAAKRQEALANQVNRRVFAHSPDARVIFYTERSSDDAASASLKADVADRTQRAPLLVALTNCLPSGASPALVPPMGEGETPFEHADLVFAIPQPDFHEGRQTAGRSAHESLVAIPPVFIGADSPVLVEARRLSDPDLAVPEDRVMLFPGDQLPLVLQPGAYKIQGWTRDGVISEPVLVTVT